jgi:hypothetical protein
MFEDGMSLWRKYFLDKHRLWQRMYIIHKGVLLPVKEDHPTENSS